MHIISIINDESTWYRCFCQIDLTKENRLEMSVCTPLTAMYKYFN